MRSVRLKVLKNKLGAYVRLAASGETVLVTDRDRVVAELVPPRDSRSPLVEATRKAWLSAPAVVAEGRHRGYPWRPCASSWQNWSATARSGEARRDLMAG